MHEKISVYVVEPSEHTRELLASMLTREPFDLLGCFASVRTSSEAQYSPQLLVAGMMEGRLELREMETLRREFPAARIIALSDDCCDELKLQVLRLGSVAFLRKDMSPQALTSAFVLAATHDLIMYSSGSRFYEAQLSRATTTEQGPRHAGLSPRETTILYLLKDGDSNKHIARKLGIAEATVKCHVKAILRKINVRNRFDAAMWALRSLDKARSQPTRTHPRDPDQSAAEAGRHLAPASGSLLIGQ